VLIPAAGVGKRFGAAVPKQYLELAGRPVIDYAIGAFIGHPAIAGCVVVLGSDDGWWDETSRYAGNARDDDWVLVHDAARPCLRRSDLDRLLAALADEPVGALLAVPIADTVKQAQAGRVAATLPRSALWRAYTPQAFPLGLLRSALAHAEQQDLIVTDDASAVELLGHRPALIEGSTDNIKITRPEDLPLAAFFLNRQAQDQATC